MLIECDRVLIRASALHEIPETRIADRRGTLNRAVHWNILRLDVEIVERARRPFSCEPVRTLDAIHLASALFARSVLPGIALLSLDQRLRACGAALGFYRLPK
jgi:predicted nucleic acid-binding protein